MANVEGVFLQIALTSIERNAITFLWVAEYLDAKIEVLRMPHVSFGARLN